MTGSITNKIKTLDALKAAVFAFPTLRIGQIIYNSVDSHFGPDIFNISDERLEAAIRKYIVDFKNK